MVARLFSTLCTACTFLLGIISPVPLLHPCWCPFAGVCSEIKALSEGHMAKVVKEVTEDKRKYPPAAFVHMPRDAFTASAINQNAAILREEVGPCGAGWWLVQRMVTFSG